MPGKAKIVIIGAGGTEFPLRLVRDVLARPELRESRICLFDINGARLRRCEALVREVVRLNSLDTPVEATTNRRRALDGAGYVIVTFQVGGVEAYRHDIEIPRRFGIDQQVGDTLGPGGVFRGLRTISVLESIAADMKELCPGALMLQYANPMSINCLGLFPSRIKVVGLCHSVQGTSQLLAGHLGVPYEKVSFKCFGINHQAWYTEFSCGGADLMPEIRRTMGRLFPSPRTGRGGRPLPDRRKNVDGYYDEPVRTEIMRLTGYFHTESSHHASEYTPWFRKNPAWVRAYLPKRWDYYEMTRARQKPGWLGEMRGLVRAPLEQSGEYAATIIHSMETGVPSVIHGNVPNFGPPGSDPARPGAHLIPNLPRTCCVEVPCLVDRMGVRPTAPGPLPAACAAINARTVAVQELAAGGALTGDRDMVVQAVAMDPYTGMKLTLPEIRRMVEALFRAESRWLPGFRGKRA